MSKFGGNRRSTKTILRSALAAAPREVGLLLLPCIAERAADVARGGLCGAEAEAETEAIGADDKILIDAADDEKEAIIDGQTGDDDEGKGERRRREEDLFLLAESAATSETRRVSLLDRRERIRSASLVRRRENGGRRGREKKALFGTSRSGKSGKCYFFPLLLSLDPRSLDLLPRRLSFFPSPHSKSSIGIIL